MLNTDKPNQSQTLAYKMIEVEIKAPVQLELEWHKPKNRVKPLAWNTRLFRCSATKQQGKGTMPKTITFDIS